MKRSFTATGVVIIILGLFLLTACQSLILSLTPTVAAKPTNSNPTRTLAPTSTAEPTSVATKTPTALPTLVITPSGPATCATAAILPVVDDVVEQTIPDPAEDDWSSGPDSARITIYEYTDFQCQICATLAMSLREVQAMYPEDVRVILRYLPLSEENDKADLAAQAAEAAGLQDKYWEMHDLLFSNQDEWIFLSVDEFSAWLADQTDELELNRKQFVADLNSDEIVTKVFEATQQTNQTGLTNPPALFFNKILYQDWVDSTSLSNMVEYFMLPDRAYSTCPEMTIDPDKKYTATFATEKGDIVFELYPEEALMAVNNFVFLAREKWYDNTPFFRVIPSFVVQGGDPTGTGAGKPGYLFTNEVTPKLRFNEPGMLAMANYGDGTNGSQFFVTYSAIPEYDGKYTIFGKVIEGMEVLESLRPRNPDYDQILLPADMLLSVTIKEEQ